MKDNDSAFNSVEYDTKIETVLPYYSEFNKQIYDLVNVLEFKNLKWLDTGCGTGNLIYNIKNDYPEAEFVLCDPSENMLAAAKSKFKDIKNVQFRNISSQQLDYKNEFNIVTSIQSHHYLGKKQRAKAVEKCYNALKYGGVYITFENISLSSSESDNIGMKRWKNYMIKNGKTEEETKRHIARRNTEVFPITISEHIRLLKEMGFSTVDMLWVSYMQAGFFAVK